METHAFAGRQYFALPGVPERYVKLQTFAFSRELSLNGVVELILHWIS